MHVLLLDGHSTHVTLKAIEICRNNNVSLMCLPAHSSHILQPLDVSVYCHVKKVWRTILQEYYATSKCHNLDKESFPPLLKKLYSSGKASTRLHAIDGFENTGFYPLNNNNIDKSNTKDSSGHKLVMQYDSNLVTYDGFSRAT
jgi:hypothetical protein